VRLELTRTPGWWQVKKRALGLAPSAGPSNAARGGAQSSKDHPFLPEWVESAIGKITGGGGRALSVNTSMSCLDKIHIMLSNLVEGIKRENMAHIARALFCPCLACKGVIRVHEKNGTFVAVAEEGRVLYARCADISCSCDEDEIKSDWANDVVKGSGRRPWVRLSVDKLEKMERDPKRQKHELM
jgi:hypothetical protein